MRSGYFLGAVLLHLILFLLIATYVIWKAPPPPPTEDFHAVAVKVAPPPVQPPSSGAAANNPQFEPQPVVVPVVTPPSVITTANCNAFKMDASKVLDQALSHLSDQMAQGSGLSQGGGGLSGIGSGFGSSTGTSAQLTGYFYDMKQAPDRQPTEYSDLDQKVTDKWAQFLAKYISSGWDDTMLEPYYKSKSPLYTDCFAITRRLSEEAPAAFGLEKEVQPARWVIHYHCKVMAPEEGDYRFVGFGDDLMEVKINGTLVLDAGWELMTKKDDLHEIYPTIWCPVEGKGRPGHTYFIKGGASFHVETNEPVDMDVLIGDEGGKCAFFLMIEKVGNTYEKLPDGTPKLPFFQIGSKPIPTFKSDEDHPPYSTTPEPWQAAPD